MKTLIIVAAALSLCACAEAGPAGGVATYDALRQASQACEAKGGKLVLTKDSDSQDIGNYACERK
ncbi:MAG: hypothetical protein E7812_06535 [Phenylobacterium sp.]|nr:MAG: hypothetical protein E7812_06535 [Phenylobacterium sp.]